jgi:acyl-CoA synthetase (AMP-forming)/AMP-acid ligase II
MKTMVDLYERNAALYPNREIYVFGDTRRTYEEYLTRIRQLASAMERAGLGYQDRAGLFASNSLEYFEVLGGCEYGAFIAAAYNFRSAPPELEYLIGYTEPRILFLDAAGLASVAAVRPGAPNITRYVFIGAGAPDWATPFADFLSEGDPAGPSLRPRAEDYCNLFFTSGTTGRPKGVPFAHRSLLTIAGRTGQEEEMSLLQVTPAFHIGGRCPPLGAIWNAGKIVLHSGFDATEWLETVQKERINVTFMVPMMMQAVLDHPRVSDYDISSLQWVMAGSTAIPPPLLTRAIAVMGQVFYVAYGSTEGGGLTRLRRTETRADGPPEMTARLASVGHAETPVDLVLLDDNGNPVPQGEIGEVCVRPDVFSGYWNNPQATTEAMHGEYFRTGDLGRFDERRYLYLVDRKKDMIISGGENIYSREVEDALHRHPAVKTASVIGVADERWGERVLAVVVRNPGEDLDEASLIAFAHTQLARFKCPKQIEFMDELPLSGTGKIDKIALRTRFASQKNGASL